MKTGFNVGFLSSLYLNERIVTYNLILVLNVRAWTSFRVMKHQIWVFRSYLKITIKCLRWKCLIINVSKDKNKKSWINKKKQLVSDGWDQVFTVNLCVRSCAVSESLLKCWKHSCVWCLQDAWTCWPLKAPSPSWRPGLSWRVLRSSSPSPVRSSVWSCLTSASTAAPETS